ncbi:MAG: hypothetical protein ACJZ70_07255 [Limisphaerales bacterium]
MKPIFIQITIHENRTVLMVREAMKGDPHTEPEPWTWIRTQGRGRVFYTASGHDQRVWNHMLVFTS